MRRVLVPRVMFVHVCWSCATLRSEPGFPCPGPQKACGATGITVLLFKHPERRCVQDGINMIRILKARPLARMPTWTRPRELSVGSPSVGGAVSCTPCFCLLRAGQSSMRCCGWQMLIKQSHVFPERADMCSSQSRHWCSSQLYTLLTYQPLRSTA